MGRHSRGRRTRIGSDAEVREAIYKRTLLPPDCPRRGDRAAIVKDHHRSVTGLEVKVVNDPHYADVFCAECGQKVTEWIVEIEHDDPRFPKASGPYFMPVAWLRRILPLSSAAKRVAVA